MRRVNRASDGAGARTPLGGSAPRACLERIGSSAQGFLMAHEQLHEPLRGDLTTAAASGRPACCITDFKIYGHVNCLLNTFVLGL